VVEHVGAAHRQQPRLAFCHRFGYAFLSFLRATRRSMMSR
jgi:hypothetical protein